jgi:mono/diheme cytochrome c family protein
MRIRFFAMLFCALTLRLAAPAFAEATGDDAKIDEGAATYENYCQTCHGIELHNNAGIAFDLRRLHADDYPRFVNSVLSGTKAMPAWVGTLTGEQIEALWAYVRANANDARSGAER